LLHEWEYDVADEPQLLTSEIGEVSFNKPEPINNLITWVYENGSFVPIGKLTENESFSIVSDYLGTPVQAFNEQGELVWARELDIYGRVRKEKGI
ncbi:RHS domain-containing protein, partial [Capnocytophaga canimorsus]|uniref:RHS domain-containing protein n=1 Tax=Capnocytophaga canimorsus TaxID=28188 RepID=UPI001BB36A81